MVEVTIDISEDAIEVTLVPRGTTSSKTVTPDNMFVIKSVDGARDCFTAYNNEEIGWPISDDAYPEEYNHGWNFHYVERSGERVPVESVFTIHDDDELTDPNE